MGDSILDDDLIAAMVGDGVVEQLRRCGVQCLVVFIGDIGSHLSEQLAGLGIQIRASDVDLFADVGRGDSFGELFGGLVIVFRDLAMALLMFDHVLGYLGRHPDGNVELQRHLDLRDRDCRVRGVRLPSLSADTGIGKEFGIALRVFPSSQGRHIGRRSGRIKRAVREIDRLYINCRPGRFPMLTVRREIPPPEPADDKHSQQHTKYN